MRPDPRAATPQQPEQPDLREVLTSVFGLMSPDVGQIEWLLDRIESSGGRTWA